MCCILSPRFSSYLPKIILVHFILQINWEVGKYFTTIVQQNNRRNPHKEARTARPRPEEIKFLFYLKPTETISIHVYIHRQTEKDRKRERKSDNVNLSPPSTRFPLFPSGIDCLLDLFRRSNIVKIPLLQPRGNSLQTERMRPRVSSERNEITSIMEAL